MKHVKTFEGFFDFFKRKYSDLDQLVVDLSNKLKSKDVESINIDKFDTGVSSDIDTNNKNIQNVKYSVNFDLPITWVIESNGLSVTTPTAKVWGYEYGDSIIPADADVEYMEGNHYIFYRYKNIKYPHAGAGHRVIF